MKKVGMGAQKLINETETLQEENMALKEQIEKLTAENKGLKAEIKKLEK